MVTAAGVSLVLILLLPYYYCHYNNYHYYNYHYYCSYYYLGGGRNSPQWARTSSITRFLDHTRLATVGRIPVDECSARRRDLYLTRHNNHNRETSMPSVGFEPTISSGERPQTYALDRAATGTGSYYSDFKYTLIQYHVL